MTRAQVNKKRKEEKEEISREIFSLLVIVSLSVRARVQFGMYVGEVYDVSVALPGQQDARPPCITPSVHLGMTSRFLVG